MFAIRFTCKDVEQEKFTHLCDVCNMLRVYKRRIKASFFVN